jgi:hypothetical protein
MIKNGNIKVSILGDRLFTEGLGSTDTALARIKPNGINIYLRKSSATIFEDAVHEGQHAIDFSNKFGYSPLKNTLTWETRSHMAEAEYIMRASGKSGMPSAEFITDYVKRMYSNWNQPFDPYTWIK